MPAFPREPVLTRPLPMSAFPQNPETLLPHRPPLLLLDAVDGVDADGAWGCLTLRPGNIFLNAEGVLERVAFAEIMAQCFAAFGAARHAQQSEVGEANEADAASGNSEADGGSGGSSPTQPAVGYLAALRDVRVLGEARVGDVLHAAARATATLGGITVVEGIVRRGEEVLACGQCKIFVPPAPESGAEQHPPLMASASSKGQSTL